MIIIQSCIRAIKFMNVDKYQMLLSDVKFHRFLGMFNEDVQYYFIKNRKQIYQDCNCSDLLQYIGIQDIEDIVMDIRVKINNKLDDKKSTDDIISFYEKEYHDGCYYQLALFLLEYVMKNDVKNQNVQKIDVILNNHYC